MDSMRLEKISRAYDRHPLRAATILERLRKSGRYSNISEVDLATDDLTLITDQNHTGGMEAVIELAQRIGLQREDHVLDIGTGLGGTPRVLAECYGCRCHGIELTRSRYHDAVELTRLVRLQHLVTLTCGDFLTGTFPQGPFDVIIGQDTFMHFEDLEAALQKCSTLLDLDGWLIIEDGFLRRAPADETERRQLAAAWDQWNGRFSSLNDWERAVRNCDLHTWVFEDRTAKAQREYQARLQRLHRLPRPVERQELSGWRLGEALIHAGLMGTMRLFCRKQFLKESAGLPA